MSTTPTTTGLFQMPSWLVTALKDANLVIEATLTLGGVTLSGSKAVVPINTSPSGAPVTMLSEISGLIPKLPTDPITAGIDAGAAALNVASQVIQAENTPQMQAGRLNVAIQKALDKIAADNAEAQVSGQADAVDADLTP
jgi:hypothetical protein